MQPPSDIYCASLSLDQMSSVHMEAVEMNAWWLLCTFFIPARFDSTICFFFFFWWGGYIESIIFLGRSKFKTFVDDITYDISIGVLASTSLFFLEPEVAFYGLFTVQVHCTDMAN